MKVDDFLRKFADAIGASPESVRPDVMLKDLEGWDSMGQLSTVALFDELGVRTPAGALQNSASVQDIIALAGNKVEL